MRSSVSMSSLGTRAVFYIKAFRRYTSFLSSPDIVYLLLLYTTKPTKSTSPGCWPTNKAVFRRSTRIRHAILNIIIIIHNSNISFRLPEKCRYILKNCLNSILFLWFIPYQRTWCVTGGLLALLQCRSYIFLSLHKPLISIIVTPSSSLWWWWSKLTWPNTKYEDNLRMAAEVKAPMSANNNKLLHAVLLKVEFQLISVQYKFTVNIMHGKP